jgi:hypothetical protein
MNEGHVAGRVPFGRLFLGNFEGYLKIARDEAARLKLSQELADQAAGAKMPGQVAGNDWTSLSTAARRATALRGYRRGRGPAAGGLPVEPRMDGESSHQRHPLYPLAHNYHLSALRLLGLTKTHYSRMRENVNGLGLESVIRPCGLDASSILAYP